MLFHLALRSDDMVGSRFLRRGRARPAPAPPGAVLLSRSVPGPCDTEAGVKGLPAPNWGSFNCANARRKPGLATPLGVAFVGARHDNGEAIAFDLREPVTAPDPGLHHSGDMAQHLFAGLGIPARAQGRDLVDPAVQHRPCRGPAGRAAIGAVNGPLESQWRKTARRADRRRLFV